MIQAIHFHMLINVPFLLQRYCIKYNYLLLFFGNIDIISILFLTGTTSVWISKAWLKSGQCKIESSATIFLISSNDFSASGVHVIDPFFLFLVKGLMGARWCARFFPQVAVEIYHAWKTFDLCWRFWSWHVND